MRTTTSPRTTAIIWTFGNFGHGQQYLALALVMLNVFAFLYHTVLDLCDTLYRLVRAELVACRTFFNDLQALTRYLFFPSWQALL